MLKTILFDLDGTLLPMEEPRFLEGYFGLLTRAMAQDGFDGKAAGIGGVAYGGAAAVARCGEDLGHRRCGARPAVGEGQDFAGVLACRAVGVVHAHAHRE